MRVSIVIDSKGPLSQLQELGQDRQGPFVLARGLNLLAKRVQQALRLNINESVQVRRKTWINNQVRIDSGTWATKTRLRVLIFLSDQAAFIGDMETGEQHIPLMGRKYLALPNSKSLGNGILGKDNPLRISNLGLHQTPHGLQGNLRTFVVHSASGKPLVLQRVANEPKGKARRGIRRATGLRLLYTLIKSSKRPQRLSWNLTAGRTVASEQAGVFSGVISSAIRDARVK